ncbi:hypothetical protein [Coprococcus eutactus]|uniref:hypothetical protein n=1 Tax=Coprococcus eutactus TaxID=33043 RepID=UPI0006C21CC4|nr:hypothetical protein [Coprococcus eutactus]CUM93591.1 Transcription initiation factor TFIID%2C subunit TAF12 (also component of histone acetyltransferase SAGA) [Coprococcus eutactus]
MSDNNMNQMPDGMNPNGADGPQPSQNQQGDAGQQYSADQQYAGQYGQQQYGANQQYAGQYGQQQYGANQQYAGQYGQQQYGANQQYAGQYGQQQYGANQQYAGQYGQQQYGANQQYAGQYGQQQYGANQQYAGQYGQQQYDANQQFADQYGQQMNAQQSVYDQTVNMYGDQAHKPESPKKRKGIKIAIIAVVAALVIIAAFVVVFFVFIKKSPKDAVKDAMENTAKELENNNIVGIVGADDIDVDKLDVQSDFTIDKVAGDGKLDGSTFTFDASTAKSDGQNSFKLDSSMTLAGETVSADVVMIGQTLYMSCPDLFTKTFSFDMNSVMAELDSKDAGAGGSVDSEALQKIIDEDLKPAADKLAESITYEKVGKDEFTNANGKTIKADHYTVTITTDAIDEFSQALVDCLNKYMDSNLSDDMMDQMGVTKDQLKQSIGTIPSLVSAVMTKDAVANVYVENDKVIRVDWDYDLAAAGVKISFTADYMGDGNVTSDAVTKIALTYGSDVNIELKSESKTDTSGDKISTDKKYTLSAMSGGESQEFTGNVTSDYDKNSGKMSGSISVDVQGETAQAAFEGVLADVKKGESFSINDAKLTVTVSGEDVLQCSGNLKVAEKDNKIEAPAAGDVVDYSVLNSDDVDQYINMDKMEKIVSAWSEIFDSVSVDSRLDGKFGTDSKDTEEEEPETTEAATTEKATTEKSNDSTEEEDLSKVTLSLGDKSVKINDPKGYERSYASEYTISYNDEKGDVYASYSTYTHYSASDLVKNMKDTYTEYYNDENSKVNEMTDGTVKAKDGTEVTYLVIQLTSYDMDRTEVLLVYPTGEDVVTCSISYWDKVDKVDAQKLCETFMDAIEIK